MELKDRAKRVFDVGFNIALRSKLVSVPLIGNYMDVVYTESMQAIRDVAFQNALEKLDEEKVDKDYLDSLEFLNLLVRTFKMALDEIEMDKCMYFGRLIKNSLESPERIEDTILIILKLFMNYQLTKCIFLMKFTFSKMVCIKLKSNIRITMN